MSLVAKESKVHAYPILVLCCIVVYTLFTRYIKFVTSPERSLITMHANRLGYKVVTDRVVNL